MRRHSGIEANHFYYVHGWTHRAQPIRFLFTLETLKEWNRVRDETKATDTPHYIIDTSDAALDKTPRICARVQVDVFCIIDKKILYRRSLNCVRALFGGLFAQVFSSRIADFTPSSMEAYDEQISYRFRNGGTVSLERNLSLVCLGI